MKKWDILFLSSKDENMLRGIKSPKIKEPLKALLLLSVLTEKFSPSPTCHSLSDHSVSEQDTQVWEEISHMLRGLKTKPPTLTSESR